MVDEFRRRDEYRRPMSSFRLSSVLWLLVFAFAGCADPRARAEKTIREVGVEQIRKDAALLYKELFASRPNDFQVVRRAAWPKSFQRLNPLRVGAYQDGFSIALSAEAGGEEGLYVVPQHMERLPNFAQAARYEEIADGVFWYSFGN